MKLLIASDIHGSLKGARQATDLAREHNVDFLVLLGDILYHGPRNPLPEEHDPQGVAKLLNEWKSKIISVRGNCDAEVDQMMLQFPCLADYALINDETASIYLTHGHLCDPDNLPPICSDEDRTWVFASGHTHVKMLEKRNGVLLVNPGSTSLPKDGIASVALYEEGCFSLLDLASGNALATASVSNA